MNNKPIGIFDSGVGGLTVLAELQKQLKNENFIYLGDTLNFPYGNKSKDEIVTFSINNVKQLIKKDVKAIIIACGTATSQSIDVLKDTFSIPIIGIIEPTTKYVSQKHIQKIGVIATEGTIRSKAWEKALKTSIPGIEVISQACPMLAEIAEEGLAKSNVGREKIRQYMDIFIKNNVSDIILGCTHYPIYREIIHEEMPYAVNLIDTGTSVAHELKLFLESHSLQNCGAKSESLIFLTKPEKEFENISKNILQKDISINSI